MPIDPFAQDRQKKLAESEGLNKTMSQAPARAQTAPPPSVPQDPALKQDKPGTVRMGGAAPVWNKTVVGPPANFKAPTGGPGGAAPPGGAMADSTGVSTGRFVNFDRYFNANHDNAAKMTQNVTQSAARGGQEAKAGFDAVVGNANAAIAAGTPGHSGQEDVRMPSFGKPAASTTAAAQGAPESLKGPTRLTNTPITAYGNISVDQARERAGQGYTGPDGIYSDPGYGEAQKKISAAAEKARALTTDGGRQEIALGMGASSRGGAALDSALMGSMGQRGFKEVADRYGGMEKYLQDQAAGVAQNVAAAKDYTSRLQQSYGNKVQQYDDQAALDQSNKDAASAKTQASEAQRQADRAAMGAPPFEEFINETNMWGNKNQASPSVFFSPDDGAIYDSLTAAELQYLADLAAVNPAVPDWTANGKSREENLAEGRAFIAAKRKARGQAGSVQDAIDTATTPAAATSMGGMMDATLAASARDTKRKRGF